jgi:hypothetical protein
MSVNGVHEAMQRYFETLGTERFVEAVDSEVTWTVTDTGRVVAGADEVKSHVDALHAAMVDTRTQDLLLSEDVAVLEGDCSAPDDPDGRLAFCVIYEVRDGRVSAIRLYGRLEGAVAGDNSTMRG